MIPLPYINLFSEWKERVVYTEDEDNRNGKMLKNMQHLTVVGYAGRLKELKHRSKYDRIENTRINADSREGHGN